MNLFSTKLFPIYVWENPEGHSACIILLISAVVFFGALICAQGMWRMRSDAIFDLEQLLLPIHTYAFSMQGEAEVYEEGVRILRSGTCVSPMLNNIWTAWDSGTERDRILSVKWLDVDGPRITDIRLGPVDRTSLDRLKEFIEHYGKG